MSNKIKSAVHFIGSYVNLLVDMDTNNKMSLNQRIHNLVSENMDIMDNIVQAFERNTYHANIIIDVQKNEICFVSNNIYKVFGAGFNFKYASDYETILDWVPSDELNKLIRLGNHTLQFTEQFSKDIILKFTLSVNIQIFKNKRRRTVNLKMTPLFVSNDVKILYVLCSISLSSNHKPGNPILANLSNNLRYSYSKESQRWTLDNEIVLSEQEKSVLSLSAQGLTAKEIADSIHKSLDSIKAYKRNVFNKLGVNNISSAIVFAQNNKLI